MVKKWVVILLSVLLAAFVIATGVLAAELYTKTYTVSFTVTASPGLKVYSDPAMTVEMTSIEFGNVSRGSTTYKEVYIKNIGDTDLYGVYIVSDLPDTYGTLTSDLSNFTITANGGSASGHLILKVLSTSPLGTNSSSVIVFTCSY